MYRLVQMTVPVLAAQLIPTPSAITLITMVVVMDPIKPISQLIAKERAACARKNWTHFESLK